jgi:hypothetical protein
MLNISAAQNRQVEILISDMQGRELQKQTVALAAGFNSIPVTLANLAAGTYLLRCTNEHEMLKTVRFVIQ